jgi:hypothetical protein
MRAVVASRSEYNSVHTNEHALALFMTDGLIAGPLNNIQ